MVYTQVRCAALCDYKKISSRDDVQESFRLVRRPRAYLERMWCIGRYLTVMPCSGIRRAERAQPLSRHKGITYYLRGHYCAAVTDTERFRGKKLRLLRTDLETRVDSASKTGYD